MNSMNTHFCVCFKICYKKCIIIWNNLHIISLFSATNNFIFACNKKQTRIKMKPIDSVLSNWMAILRKLRVRHVFDRFNFQRKLPYLRNGSTDFAQIWIQSEYDRSEEPQKLQLNHNGHITYIHWNMGLIAEQSFYLFAIISSLLYKISVIFYPATKHL